jgi:hypothetical protein
VTISPTTLTFNGVAMELVGDVEYSAVKREPLGRLTCVAVIGRLIPERCCRVCLCTDDDCSLCIFRTGSPCYWVEQDLCSACVVPAAA